MLVFACLLLLATGAPPNTSFATLPVAYYGSSYANKTPAVYEMFSKLRVVILMQQDGDLAAGHCWYECCPNGHCPLNASVSPGCNPSCDQHGKQVREFSIIKETARKAGRPLPHAMLYMNSVYDWPFDATHGLGAENIDVLDINGNPHMERCDPGIYPSFFLDHGRPAGQAAFQNIFKKYIAGGDTADGVYLDCFDLMPLQCNSTGYCTARRKSHNKASVVTNETVTNYIAGKKKGLSAATRLVEQQSGGIFTAKTWNTKESHDPYGANAAILTLKDPKGMIGIVQTVMVKNGYKYVLVGGQAVVAGGSKLERNESDLASVCTQHEVASFMLGMEEGCFLICQGWDDDFAKPLGKPLGPAKVVNGVMSRSFASGTKVSWDEHSGNITIYWAGDSPLKEGLGNGD